MWGYTGLAWWGRRVLVHRGNLRIMGYFVWEGTSEGHLVQTRSVVSRVAKIVSIFMELKGGKEASSPNARPSCSPVGHGGVPEL